MPHRSASIVRAAVAIPLLFPCRAAAQSDVCATPTHDLYCIDLTATARGGAATGTVALNYIPGPFTVPLTVDGYYRYAPRITVRDLPAPESRTTYVAWAATPTMDVIRRLGVVTNGANEGREFALDRFLILISAERDSAAPEPRGPIVLRGESPSNRMRPPDLYRSRGQPPPQTRSLRSSGSMSSARWWCGRSSSRRRRHR